MVSPPKHARRAREGFTLVELLVVIAIIATLIALLFPAIQAVRGAARAMSCRNNLRQFGIAVANYESSRRAYPSSYTKIGWSAQAQLLPYLEQGNLYDAFDLNKSYKESGDMASMRIPSYLCPSEQNDTVRLKNDAPIHYPLNYGVNLGVWFVYDPKTGAGGDGAFRPIKKLKHRSFSDGLSMTLCAAEVKAYTPYFRNAGMERSDLEEKLPELGEDIAALTSGAEAKMGPKLMKNTGHTEWVDGRVHQIGFTTALTPNTKVMVEQDGRKYDVDWTNQQEGKSDETPTYAAVTARSYHRGLVNVVMMDGSVHSINNDIDLEVWRALSTRAGRDVVPEVF
jgi:prepilin-type N-terminal cleavage/methylation domain-containing protein